MSSAVQCPSCGEPAPLIRRPGNWRQALWGGWTCGGCGAEMDRWGRKVGQAGVVRQSWTRDDSTVSGRPAGLTLSDAGLRHLRPDLYGIGRRLREAVGLDFPLRRHVAEQLDDGDANAAVVVSARPLVVAAYAPLFGRVAMLAFPEKFDLANSYGLREGSRLVTANGYGREPEPDADLFLPRDHSSQWTGLQPLIADFVTDDETRLAELKAEIPEAEWRRAARLGEAYRARFPDRARDGRPIHCLIPA